MTTPSKFEFQTIALALWKTDQQVFGASEKSAKELGIALNNVKAVSPHGEFQNWLKCNSISRSRASYCMRVANGKQAKAKKPRADRFILDGFSSDWFEVWAARKGVSLPQYMRDVLWAYQKMERTSETASAYQNWIEYDIARLKRIPLLAEGVIHATSWQERTRIRIERLLITVKPNFSDGLTHFVEVFEQVYGPDKLPLLWVLGVRGHLLNVDKLGAYYRTPSKTVRDGRAAEVMGTPADFGRPDYSTEEEDRRIAGLKAEQAAIESQHAELYQKRYGKYVERFLHGKFAGEFLDADALVRVQARALKTKQRDTTKTHFEGVTAVSDAFPDDEPGVATIPDAIVEEEVAA